MPKWYHCNTIIRQGNKHWLWYCIRVMWFYLLTYRAISWIWVVRRYTFIFCYVCYRIEQTFWLRYRKWCFLGVTANRALEVIKIDFSWTYSVHKLYEVYVCHSIRNVSIAYTLCTDVYRYIHGDVDVDLMCIKYGYIKYYPLNGSAYIPFVMLYDNNRFISENVIIISFEYIVLLNFPRKYYFESKTLCRQSKPISFQIRCNDYYYKSSPTISIYAYAYAWIRIWMDI